MDLRCILNILTINLNSYFLQIDMALKSVLARGVTWANHSHKITQHNLVEQFQPNTKKGDQTYQQIKYLYEQKNVLNFLCERVKKSHKFHENLTFFIFTFWYFIFIEKYSKIEYFHHSDIPSDDQNLFVNF